MDHLRPFCLFSVFYTTLQNKTVRLQRDLNSDRRSRRRARWHEMSNLLQGNKNKQYRCCWRHLSVSIDEGDVWTGRKELFADGRSNGSTDGLPYVKNFVWPNICWTVAENFSKQERNLLLNESTSFNKLCNQLFHSNYWNKYVIDGALVIGRSLHNKYLAAIAMLCGFNKSPLHHWA